MKKLEESNAYKEIVDDKSMKTFTIPYHTDTGIIVTKDNIEELLEFELNYYEGQLKSIQEYIPTFNVSDLKKRLRTRLESRMNKCLLKVDYIYINSETIKDASKEIEMLPNFVEWCVE
jgi:hypothetical protein